MGCLFINVVCELGLECCEIVWFIFGVGVRVLRGFFFSMRGKYFMDVKQPLMKIKILYIKIMIKLSILLMLKKSMLLKK